MPLASSNSEGRGRHVQEITTTEEHTARDSGGQMYGDGKAGRPRTTGYSLMVEAGRWRTIWWEGDVRVRKSIGSKQTVSRAKAAEIANALYLASIQRTNGLPLVEGKVTLGQWAKRYRDEAPIVSPTTLACQIAAFESFADLVGANTPMSDVGAQHVRVFANHLAKSKTSRATVATYLQRCKRVFMVACERNPPIIRENPFNKQLTRELSSLFSTQVKAEHRHVTLEEFDRMMAKVDPQYPFIRGIMACCRLAATRYVEAHDLRWEDIDYERGCLAIRGKLDEQGREFSTTKRSRRTVPMSAKLAEILRSIPKDQRAGPCEANVTLKTVYRLLDKAREDAGIDDYGKQTHALRASCINDWMDADHTLANIAEWAGHSLDVMMTHYRERGSDRRIEGFHQKDKG